MFTNSAIVFFAKKIKQGAVSWCPEGDDTACDTGDSGHLGGIMASYRGIEPICLQYIYML